MSADFHSASRQAGKQAARHEDSLLAGLSRRVVAPDLTRSIMGRLGYMPVRPTIARRRRVRRWINRAGILAVAGLSLFTGLRIYQSGPDVRRPVGPTVPDALGNDVLRQQNRIGNVIQTIQHLAPQIRMAPAAEKPPRVEPAEAAPPLSDQSTPEWTGAPARWV
jgi:hypothetical protein